MPLSDPLLQLIEDPEDAIAVMCDYVYERRVDIGLWCTLIQEYDKVVAHTDLDFVSIRARSPQQTEKTDKTKNHGDGSIKNSDDTKGRLSTETMHSSSPPPPPLFISTFARAVFPGLPIGKHLAQEEHSPFVSIMRQEVHVRRVLVLG